MVYEAVVHSDDSWTVTETVDVDFSEECPEFFLYAHQLNYFGRVIEKEVIVSSLSSSSSIKQRHLRQRELSRMPIDAQFKEWMKGVVKTLSAAILTAIILIIVRLILNNL